MSTNKLQFYDKVQLITSDTKRTQWTFAYVKQCSTIMDMMASTQFDPQSIIPIDIKYEQLKNFHRFVKFYKMLDCEDTTSFDLSELKKTADYLGYLTPIKFQYMIDTYTKNKLKLYITYYKNATNQRLELKIDDLPNLDNILDKIKSSIFMLMPSLTTYAMFMEIHYGKKIVSLDIRNNTIKSDIKQYNTLYNTLCDRHGLIEFSTSIGQSNININYKKNPDEIFQIVGDSGRIEFYIKGWDKLKDISEIICKCCEYFDEMTKERTK